jgi:hypothetical protein
MGQPVVHFEIIGKDPARLRGYYGELFGWEFDTSGRRAQDRPRARPRTRSRGRPLRRPRDFHLEGQSTLQRAEHLHWTIGSFDDEC